MPLSKEDFAYLMKGDKPPEDAIKAFEEEMSKAPIRRCKPGEKIELGGGRELTVPAEGLKNDDKMAPINSPTLVLLLPQGMPIPCLVEKVKDKWFVSAKVFVATRKAAEQAMKKEEKRGGAASGESKPPQ